jgi:hypothetical protein
MYWELSVQYIKTFVPHCWSIWNAFLYLLHRQSEGNILDVDNVQWSCAPNVWAIIFLFFFQNIRVLNYECLPIIMVLADLEKENHLTNLQLVSNSRPLFIFSCALWFINHAYWLYVTVISVLIHTITFCIVFLRSKIFLHWLP